MNKVSVIIPVYNAEKYIRECMDSLLGQTLKEIEIICVLDCPSDQTGEILKEIARNDDRIFLIENDENMGAACSRNKGMRYITAPYVIFLDADDVFELDMLYSLYHRAEETSADLCLFEFDTFFDGEGWMLSANEQECEYAEAFSIADLPENGLNCIGAATWNRIYKTSFLIENTLNFQNLKTQNDVYIGIMSLLLAERIAHTKTNKVYLHYRIGIPGQIMAKANPMDTCMAYQKVHDELKERELWEQYKSCFWIKLLISLTRDIASGSNDQLNRQAYCWIQKEGVSSLEIDKVKEEDFNCPYYAAELRKFIDKDYETRWFCYAINLQMKLFYYKERIIQQCKLWMEEKKIISVWGAGQYGCTWLHFFDENYINCEIVIDIDKKKRGTYIEHRPVYVFEEVAFSLDIIIVANIRYIDQIKKTVYERNREIRVVTVNDLCGDFD